MAREGKPTATAATEVHCNLEWYADIKLALFDDLRYVLDELVGEATTASHEKSLLMRSFSLSV